MSSLSRTFARASRRGNRLMEQYQQPGVYAWAEENYKQAQETKKRRRLALKAAPVIPVIWAPDDGLAHTRSAAEISTPMSAICPTGIWLSKPEKVMGAYSLM